MVRGGRERGEGREREGEGEGERGGEEGKEKGRKGIEAYFVYQYVPCMSLPLPTPPLS